MNEHEDGFYEIRRLEEQKKKWQKKESLCGLWDTIKQMNISIMGITGE